MPTKKLTKEEFIERSNKVHNFKYDYSKVNYINSKTKVEIICSEHNSFFQIPSDHFKGCGCDRCRGTFLSNTKEFIDKSNKIHNFKYDYSKTIYINNHTKIEIMCKEHGSFFQIPHKHLINRGCPVCGGTLKSNTSEFIEKANKIHNFKYDYSKINYTDNHTKVEIVCKEHGSFFQNPNSHLQKIGCPKCASTKNSIARRSNNLEFIEKANSTHNYIYNYELTNYINNYTKIEILCGEHGSFFQTPNSHLRGAGCPLCNTSKAEIFISKYLTEKEIPFTYQYSGCINPLTGCGLPFDFYIPNINTLIEYDGVFHYKKVRKDHNLKAQQIRDKFKTEWAIKNGYCLIRISDKENLEQRMSEIISS